ncbi:transposable element Tc1 transposase [Trichonephila clavipes]|nr:transposable element Tc1 transposase [Trichonephila clavipes]
MKPNISSNFYLVERRCQSYSQQMDCASSLHRMGFGGRRLTRVPLLNAVHRAARLSRVREHRDWSVEDWKRVAWSDKSRFRLLNINGRLRMWRQAHKAMDPACQVGNVQGHGGSIMVWGVFSGHCLGS